jgi:hypothetical protein
MIEYIFRFFLSYLFADFITGLYHWIKDTYFSPFTPIIGKKFIWPSRLHHIKPRHVIEFSDKDLMMSSALWSLIWAIPFVTLFGISFEFIVIFIAISLNDVIHKYAHMMDHERPILVTLLQRIYIIQTQEEHHLHHISPHEINYCPITPYVNIILEKFNFWRQLENLIEKISGIKPRAIVYEYKNNDTYPAGIEFIKVKNS